MGAKQHAVNARTHTHKHAQHTEQQQQQSVGSAPVELLKAEAARVLVVDLVDRVLQHLPGFVCCRR